MDTKQDIRTISAVNGAAKTSLSAFLTEATTEDTTNDEAVTTEDVDSLVTDDAASETTDDATDDADKSTEPEFDVKGRKVPLKDLLNAFETREEISRRFDDIGKREQKIKAQLDKAKKEREELDFINEKFEEMREQVLAGNPLAAMQIAVTLGAKEGEDPAGSLEALIKQSIKLADNFHSMSPEQQDAFLAKEKLSQKERILAKRELKQKAKDEELELKQFYETVLSEYKVTDDELDVVHSEIISNEKIREEFEKKDAKGKISQCVSYVLGKRLNNTLSEGIKAVAPELVGDQTFRLALLDVVDPRCTVNDVEQIVRTYLKSTGKSATEAGASTQSVAPKKPTTSNRAPTEKPKAEGMGKPVTSWKDILAKHSK